MKSLFSINLDVISSLLFFYSLCLLQNAECHHNEPNCASNSSTSVLTNLFESAEKAFQAVKHYTIHRIRIEQNIQFNPIDCAEVLKNDSLAKSGIYKIYPRNRMVKGPINVYCDMEDDGGGWTVLQRRGDFDSAKDYFFRDWNNYKNGFGNLLKDFWIGNDIIFALTNEESVSLKFDLQDWEDNSTYALYDDFWMDDEIHKYTIHVSGYRGTAGDSFTYSNDAPFTTKDKDHDKHESNCATMFKGAWWYISCHNSNLNGLYLKGKHDSYADGIEWSTWKGQHYSLKTTVIKIRPKILSIKEEPKVEKNINVDETPM